VTLNLNIPKDEWPLCTYRDDKGHICGNPVNPKRVQALGGIVRCLEHPLPKKDFTVAPAYNKGGLQLITHGDIEDIGRS
jgi:hypothetical protein